MTSDPTGIVSPNVRGEVEALRLYERIIHEHPGWTSDQVDEELVKQIYTDKRRHSLQVTFDWVLTKAQEFVNRQPDSVIPPDTKKVLLARLAGTKLELPPPASNYASEPDLFTKNEIYYEALPDGRRVVRVGGAYIITAKSWFNRVFTFAHELAHSIDPCELEGLQMKVPAYRKLASCLVKRGFVKGGQAIDCRQRTQLGEVFADWVAADITAEAIAEKRVKFKSPEQTVESAVNSVRDMCNQEAWMVDSDVELYPDASIRIGGIFAGNPKIEALLGCGGGKAADYCSFEGE